MQCLYEHFFIWIDIWIDILQTINDLYRFVNYIFVSFNNINMSITVSHLYGYWIDNFNVVITNIIIFSFLTNNNYVALEQTFLQQVIIINF